MVAAAVSDLAVDVGLVALGATTAVAQRGLASVEPGPRPVERLPRSLHRFQARVHVFLGPDPHLAAPPVQGLFAGVVKLLAAVGCRLAFVRDALPLVGELFAAFGQTVAFVRRTLALIGTLYTLREVGRVAGAGRSVLNLLHSRTVRQDHGTGQPLRPVWARPSMNWRWASTKTIRTGMAVIEAADSCTFHSWPW